MYETTRLTRNGKVTIPQNILTARKWLPGQEFNVIDTDAGILLTPSPLKGTRPERGQGLNKIRK